MQTTLPRLPWHVGNTRFLPQSGERLSDGAFSPRDHKHGSGENHDNAFDHEAILGSRKDADEYDDLPPEEAKRRLRVSKCWIMSIILILFLRCFLGKWTEI